MYPDSQISYCSRLDTGMPRGSAGLTLSCPCPVVREGALDHRNCSASSPAAAANNICDLHAPAADRVVSELWACTATAAAI